MPTNPLDQLPPLALPAEPGWWPPAPGWWFLAVFFIAVAVLGSAYFFRRWKQNAIRRQSLRELLFAYKQSATQTPQQFLQHCGRIIRQFCIQHADNRKLSTLSGKQWLCELDDYLGETCFNSDVGQQLLLQYQTEQNLNINSKQLHDTIAYFIRRAPARRTYIEEAR